MSKTRRQYAGGAISTTITSAIDDDDTSIGISATTGWPSGADPFYIVVSPGLAAEEKMLVTRTGSTLTVVTGGRGKDGTTAHSHLSGAITYPVITAIDLDESNEMASKLTTKGDLLTYAAGTFARHGVGTNAQVLIADSAQTNGIKWGEVASGGLASNSVIEAKIASSAVTEGKIADGSVSTDKIADTAVTEGKIASSAVAEAKIASSAVTEAKIASGAVTEAKIGSAAVTEAKLGSAAVTADKIGTGAVTEAKIGTSAVTEGKIAANAVVTSKVTDSAITAPKLGIMTDTTPRTGNLTLALTDRGLTLLCSHASGMTVTIPTNASVAFPTGTQVAFVQMGGGQVTFFPTTGVTMYSEGSKNKTLAQYSAAALIKTDTNTWVLIGNITA